MTTPTELVGRATELAKLEAELARARDGELRAVLLVGEPGVGKTRLTSELIRRHSPGGLALSARAYPLGTTASLGLWAEALERYLRSLGSDEVLAVCGADIDDLAALLPSARAARGGGEVAEPPRIRMLGSLARLLGRISENAVTVIALDDVHLADGSSWEALNYLTRNLGTSRILLLLAARRAELADDRVARDVLQGLEQEGLLTRLTLSALSAADVGELAASVTGGDVPGTLVTWLMERARGSPLFVVGLLRALIEEGADLAHPELRALPEDLSERVEARLALLDPPARNALELLAVIGYRAELSDLVRLSARSLDELAPILEVLVRARLVAEAEEGHELTYEIDHPLIQEAIYRNIGGARRRALHRHAARALVDAGRLGAAAPHFVRAAEPGDDEAIGALCSALRQAEEGQHHREALALLDALLELVPAGDARWQLVVAAMPLQPEWVVDHRADGDADTGVRAMRAIDQVLERLPVSPARAAVKFNLGSLLAWGKGETEEARRLVHEARTLFEEADDPSEALLCDNELGYLAALAGECDAHEAQARRVLEAGVDRGDAIVELQALCSLAWSLFVAGRLEEAEPVVRQAIAVARDCEKAYRTTYMLAFLGALAAQLGRIDEAGSLLADARASNPAFRDTFLLDYSMVVSWLAGDLDGVVTAFRDQLAWSGGISRRRAIGACLAVVALAELGRHEEALEPLRAVTDVFDGRGWWLHSRLPRWADVVSTGLLGDRVDSARTLLTAAEEMTEIGGWGWARFALADLAEAAAVSGDADAGRRAAELLEGDPWLSGNEAQASLRTFTRGAALIAARQHHDGTLLLEPAADGFVSAGWRLFEGRARMVLGVALAGTDRPAAIASLQRAADVFERCGAVVRRGRALDALSRLGPRGHRTRTAVSGPAALTAREREVARLAAEGRSARDIAGLLFIGERTVETHLANVYAKLGIGSKVELVRFATQLDL